MQPEVLEALSESILPQFPSLRIWRNPRSHSQTPGPSQRHTVSHIHSNLQVANFQRCKCAFYQRQVWVKLQLAFYLLLPTILQLYHFPPPLPPPVSNPSCLFTRCQCLYASCCIVWLHFSMYYTIKNVFLIFCVWKSENLWVVSNSLRPHVLYSPWNSPDYNTGVGSLSLLQGIFLTQGLNPGLGHCRQILYQLSHQGSPRILEWLAYPFCGLSQPRNWTRVSCIAGGFFTNWAIRDVCCLCTICVKSIINLLLHSAI